MQVRNRIYERVFDRAWIEASLPDAERRRQRQAYRAGIVHTGSIAAGVVLIMALLAGYAFTHRGIALRSAASANEQTHKIKHYLYIANMNLAQQAWENNDVGRVLELLQETAHAPERGGPSYFSTGSACP